MSNQQNSPAEKQIPWLSIIPALVILLYLVVVIRTAWLSDDAFITFRTVENFRRGFGLVYNLGERVQSYTHPLWMFLLTGWYILTDIIFGRFFLTAKLAWSALALSIIISLTTVILFSRRVARSSLAALAGLTMLLFSKSFIDYSTSGLEEPLTNLLLVLFFMIFFKIQDQGGQPDERSLFRLTFIAALAGFNRADTLLLYIPIVAWSWFRTRRKGKSLFSILAGLSPLILWELFSIFYYGFPFPNTAYAKLNNGLPQTELVWQGIVYLFNSLNLDPLTLLVIVFSLATPFLIRKYELIAPVLGILLYIAYILYIGGDFMSGRFLTAPFFMAVILLSRLEMRKEAALGMVAFFVLFGYFSGSSSLASNSGYLRETVGENGIADERGWYYRNLGLLNMTVHQQFPDYDWKQLAWMRYNDNFRVVTLEEIGRAGYIAGPYYHVVDKLALSDALLARLAPVKKEKWRIGHIERAIPDGYLETLQSRENQIKDPNLAAYFEKLSIVISADVFDSRRWVEIWNLNTGTYNGWLRAYEDLTPVAPPTE